MLKTDLYLPCTVMGCKDKSSKYWYHDSCGGRVELREDAYIYCPRCYENSIIFGWNFSCSGHGNVYQPASRQGVLNALTQLVTIMGVN